MSTTIIGSVGHILRRTFSDFYETGEQKNSDVTPRDTASASEEKEQPAESQVEAEAPPHEGDAEHAEEGGENQQRRHSVPEPAVVLSDSQQKELEDIENELHASLKTADEVEQYMDARRQEAAKADEDTKQDLRTRHLILNAEVPVGPSALQLRSDDMQHSFGGMGLGLISAQDLVEEDAKDRLIRAGNLEPDYAKKAPAFSSMAEDPHYLEKTKAYEQREKQLDRFKQKGLLTGKTVAPHGGRGGGKVPGRTDVLTETVRQQVAKAPTASNRMTREEAEMNEEVLKRMTHRLNYLRNPRYVKTSPEEVATGTSPMATLTKVELEQPYFRAFPSEALFQDYTAHATYSQELELRNVSRLSRTVRVLPPTSSQFSMDQPVFPTQHAGDVAPGLSVRVRIKFTPDSLAEFNDSITVQTENGDFAVPLRATRHPPNLDLAPLTDVGPCFQGDYVKHRLTIRNSGGDGRFELFDQRTWRAMKANMDKGEKLEVEARDSIQFSPFRIAPASFSLRAGGSVDLEIWFEPQALGEYTRRFVLLGENCTTSVHEVKGKSFKLDLGLTRLQNYTFQAPAIVSHPIGPMVRKALGFSSPLGIPAQQSVLSPAAREWLASSTGNYVNPLYRLRFDNVAPGVPLSKTFSVRNNTELPLRFRWKLHHFGDQPPQPPAPRFRIKRSASITSYEALRAGPGTETNSTQPKQYSLDAAGAMVARRRASEEDALHSLPQLPFSISEEEGTLSPLAETEFHVTFCPHRVAPYQGYYELFVEGVPCSLVQSATSGGDQVLHLKSPDGTHSEAEAEATEKRLHFSERTWTEKPNFVSSVFNELSKPDASHPNQATAEYSPRVDRESVSCLTVHVAGAGRAPVGALLPAFIGIGESALEPIEAGAQQFLGEGDSEEAEEEESPSVPAPKPLSLVSKLRKDSMPRGPPVLTVPRFQGTSVCRVTHIVNSGPGHMLFRFHVRAAVETTFGIASTALPASGPPTIAGPLVHSPQAAVPLDIIVEPSTGLVPPNGRVEVRLEVSPKAPGKFDVLIPVTTAPALPDGTPASQFWEENHVELFRGKMGGAARLLHSSLTQATGPATVPNTTSCNLAQVGALGAAVDGMGQLGLRVAGSAVAGYVKLRSPEVDFGLVSVLGSMSKDIEIVNPSPVPVYWQVKQHSPPQPPQEGSPSPTRSAWGSRKSSFSGQSATTMDTSVHKHTFAGVVLTCSPSSGVLEPGETMRVTVTCSAGSEPHRVRELLRVSTVGSPPLFVRVRGEVQAPLVYVDDTTLDLGTAFVGVPVYRTIALTNLSNLLARFSWDGYLGTDRALTNEPHPAAFRDPANLDPEEARAVASTPLYHASFSEPNGVLKEKERREVEVTFTPLRAGIVESYFAVDIVGMKRTLVVPVVCRIKSLVIGMASRPPTEEEDVLDDVLPPPMGPNAAEELRRRKRQNRTLKVAWAEKTGSMKAGTDLEAAAKLAKERADNAGATVGSLPVLNFGKSFPTFSRRDLVFEIHNLSGIPTSYRVAAKNYKATVNGKVQGYNKPAKIEPGTVVQDSTTSPMRLSRMRSFGASQAITESMATIHVDGPFPPGRTHGSKKSTVPSITVKAPLARAHEDRDKFQSMKGQQELKERRTKEEVKHYLGMQRGAAFLIHHPTGELPPFSMARIRVTCVADMPGDYKDQLLVDVVGLAQMRVPLRVSVTGTPLKFDENTVGLSVIRDPPVLAFGEVPYDAPECMKLVHIRNTGPVAATLTWKMEQALVSQPPLVDVKWGFSADDKQPLSLGIVPHSSDSLPPPFRIEPAQADVPPHGIATFKVYGRSEALSSSEKRQLEAAGISTYPRKAHFVADARWHVEDMCKGISEVDGEEEGAPLSLEASSELAGNQASHTSLSTDASWMTLRTATQITARARLKRTAAIRGSKRILTLETQLKPIVPRLEVDKRSLPDGRAHVKFGVWVTKPRSHESYARAITLTNSMGADLTFTLAATGPYTIERCETSAPKHPLTPNEVLTSSLTETRMSGIQSRLFTLPQDCSLIATVRFQPRSQFRDELADTMYSSLLGDTATQKDETVDLGATGGSVLEKGKAVLKETNGGRLIITFSNGEVQEIGLRAEALRPLLVATPVEYNFGTVHVEHNVGSTIVLGNPTEVEAEWTLSHVHVPPPKSKIHINPRSFGLPEGKAFEELKAEEEAIAAIVDDPGVFVFSSRSGQVMGPTPPLDVSSGESLRKSSKGTNYDLFPLKVEFHPKRNTQYRSRFRFHVRKGEGFDVVLEGRGTYEEHEEDV